MTSTGYVAVLSEHLTNASQYERIPSPYAQPTAAEAIDWARRGLSGKPGWPRTDQLRDTLVKMHSADGDQEAALAVRRVADVPALGGVGFKAVPDFPHFGSSEASSGTSASPRSCSILVPW